MTTFKRSAFAMVVSIVLAVGAGFLSWLLVPIFTDNVRIVYGMSAAAFGILFFMAIFSENISCEVGEGLLRYYVRGKLKGEYHLGDYALRYRIKSDMSFPPTHDISLMLTGEGGEETHIDCSPLGRSRFLAMWDLMEKESGAGIQKLDTTRKTSEQER